MSYVKGLSPEHPSLERLTYKRGDGADNFYDGTNAGSFQKASQSPSKAQGGLVIGSRSSRFGPSAYDKGLGSPGPGQYSPKSNVRSPLSGKPRTPVRASHSSPTAGRLNIQKQGEGADSFYEKNSSFARASHRPNSPGKKSIFGTTERFGKTGFEKGLGSPGPGSYSSRANTSPGSARKAASPRPGSAGRSSRSESTERLNFSGGEGADSFYERPSTFSKASQRPNSPGKKSLFGGTDRFGKTGFEKGLGSPGPGSYATNASTLRAKQAGSPRSRPGSAGTREEYSADTDGSRLRFGAGGEGADSFYEKRSSFEKAMARPGTPGKKSVFGTTERFSKTGYEKGLGSPGPGNYGEVLKSSPKKSGPPLPHFWHESDEWRNSPVAKEKSRSFNQTGSLSQI